MQNSIRLLLGLIVTFGNGYLFSQEVSSNESQTERPLSSFITKHLHSSLQLRNNHLWRGIEVATGLVYTGDVHFGGKNFYGGFWLGGNTSGEYEEFNNYIGYKNKYLTLELWDIYNFSAEATYNNTEYFNYRARETGRFWDFRSAYTVSDKLPLTLSWNTIIFGRDRNGDNTSNKYSSFVSGEYPFYKEEDLTISGRVGYSFALNNEDGEKNNFFAQEAGFNEISLVLSKNLNIGTYKIPLGLWSMWNPVDDRAFLQFSVQLYSF